LRCWERFMTMRASRSGSTGRTDLWMDSGLWTFWCRVIFRRFLLQLNVSPRGPCNGE
jgi:hypothetical protein